MPMPSKKTFAIAGVIIGVIIVTLVGLFIALAIWLFNVVMDSGAGDAVVESAQQATTQIVEDQLQGIQTDPLAYVVNGEIDTSSLQEQIEALSPQQLVLFTQEFTTQVNELVETGQLVQEQADALTSLLP